MEVYLPPFFTYLEESPMNNKEKMSRRRALRLAATGAGVASAATVAMSANPALAGATLPGDQIQDVLQAFTCGTDWQIVSAGDGDRTSDIQNALNRAQNIGGGIVYLEAGEFRISNRLLVGQNVTLMGAGAATVLRATGDSFGWMVQFRTSSFGAALKDMRLLGANRAGGVGIFTVGTGQFSGNDSYVLVENVFIHDTQLHGVQVGTGFGTREVRLHNVVVLRARRHGILFPGVDSIISNCTAASCDLDGINVVGSNNRLTGCKAFFNRGSGITVAGNRGQLSACQAQDNFGDGFKLDGADDVVLSACGADSNQLAGIRIKDCNGVSFSSASSISRAGSSTQGFGVRIQNSANCRITGVSRNNAINLNLVSSPTVDVSGLLG